MMVMLGIVVGAILGAVAAGFGGALAGALTGFVVMMVWRSRSQARERMAGSTGVGVAVFPERARQADAVLPPPRDAIASRLDAIEARLSSLERRIAAPGAVTEARTEVEAIRALAPAPDRASVATGWERPSAAPEPDANASPGAPAGFRRTPEGTLEPIASAVASTAATEPALETLLPPAEPDPVQASRRPPASPSAPPASPSAPPASPSAPSAP